MKVKKPESKIYLICHTIVIEEEKLALIKKQQSFEAYGSFFESSFINEKHKNNIEEIFTKYKILFKITMVIKCLRRCKKRKEKTDKKGYRIIHTTENAVISQYKFKGKVLG